MKILRAAMAAMTLIAAATTLHAQESPGVPRIKIVTGNTFGFISEQLVSGALVKGAPYSARAVTETTQTLADGNRIVQKSSAMVYRDSLGRERREETLPAIGSFTPQGDVGEIITISDPVAGANYTLNSKEHVAIKYAEGPIPRALTASPGMIKFVYKTGPDPKTAPSVEQLGWQVIEGVQAQGTRTTITIPAGQVGNDRAIDIVDEQWRSPDLQVIVLSKHSDPRFGETVYTLMNISRADPPATLFQVPPDYALRDRVPTDIQTIRRELELEKIQTIQRKLEFEKIQRKVP